MTRPGGLGVVIGHLPRKLSKICSLFIRRGGSICCIVTGGRRYSADLPQGGLEIKVTYFIYGPRFFPFAASIVLSTSLFTAAIACEGKLADSEPFGSGSPSRGLK